MTTKRTRLRDARSWRFDLGLCVLGLALLAWSLPAAWDGGWKVGLAALLGVPLVVVVARFPMVLDNEDGGIEIGFDSIVLIYLLCTFDALPALAVWGLGVLATQLTSGKRASAVRLQHRRRHPRRRSGGGRAAPGARGPQRVRRGSWWPWSRRRRRTSSSTTCSRRSRSPSTPRRPCAATSSRPAPGSRSPASSPSTCSATSPRSCCAATRGGRSCSSSSRWRRCSSTPARSCTAGRTPGGSASSSRPRSASRPCTSPGS